MLTIGQVASYAGLTVRAVRHYHQVGLLPEPERDTSGYRSYPAAAVPRLIRIRTLAQAGVPLAQVRELVEADPEAFAAATKAIDRQLVTQIRALQEHRRRIARLGSSDTLAVPAEVADYLDRLKAIGAPPAVTEGERNYWILIAALRPQAIPQLVANKVAQLADPRIVQIYQLIGRVTESDRDEEVEDLLRKTADLLNQIYGQADAAGELVRQEQVPQDSTFIELIDSFASGAHPAMPRLWELLAERGWTGWARVEKSTTRTRPMPNHAGLRTQSEQEHLAFAEHVRRLRKA